MGDAVKYIYDEVHGYIPLTDLELRIIDTPTFQRLRRVKQLAQAWFVYPGAVHTRFSHCLGAMYLMGRIAGKFSREGLIPKDDLQLLKVAALLHDVGHTPYSHAIETYFKERFQVTHEDISAWIIMEDPHIKDALSEHGIEPKEVAAIVSGRHKDPTYNMLLSSDLDVDRLDYLLRDALHTGVKYGLIDIHRIITTLTVDKEGYVAVPEKAVQAAESFYIARLHMYRSVYYHKTITAYQLLINAIYEEMIKEPEVREILGPFTTGDGVRRAVRAGKIYLWDDFFIGGLMNYVMMKGLGNNVLRNLIRLYLGREGYHTVLDKITYNPRELSEGLSNALTEFKRRLRSAGIGKHDVKPYFDTVKIVSDENCVRIIMNAGTSVPITKFHASIISSVPRCMGILRVYALPGCAEYVRKLSMDLLNHHVSV